MDEVEFPWRQNGASLQWASCARKGRISQIEVNNWTTRAAPNFSSFPLNSLFKINKKDRSKKTRLAASFGLVDLKCEIKSINDFDR